MGVQSQRSCSNKAGIFSTEDMVIFNRVIYCQREPFSFLYVNLNQSKWPKIISQMCSMTAELLPFLTRYGDNTIHDPSLCWIKHAFSKPLSHTNSCRDW